MRYLLIIVILLHGSCKNEPLIDTDHEINIDLNHLASESLPGLKIKSIVHLETNDSSVVGSVDHIELHHGHVYILDMFKTRAAFVFSAAGDFIGKTKYGKGPGEMINPFALYLDKGTNLIHIWDQGLFSIIQFSPRLAYMGHEVFSNPLTNFVKLENGRTLVHSHFHQDFAFKIYDADHKTVAHTFVPDMKYPGGMGLGRSIAVNKRILAITPFQYHIYELKDNEMYSAYYVNFGSYMLTMNDIEKRDWNHHRDLLSKGERVSSLNDISESESFLSFCVYFKSEVLNFAYSIKGKKVYSLNEYFGKNMLPVCTVKGLTENDLFYAIVKPEDLDNFQKTSGKTFINGDINHDGNPYLMTFICSI